MEHGIKNIRYFFSISIRVMVFSSNEHHCGNGVHDTQNTYK